MLYVETACRSRANERAETLLNCSLNGGKQVSNDCFDGSPTTTAAEAVAAATRNSFHAVLDALYAVQHKKYIYIPKRE